MREPHAAAVAIAPDLALARPERGSGRERLAAAVGQSSDLAVDEPERRCTQECLAAAVAIPVISRSLSPSCED